MSEKCSEPVVDVENSVPVSEENCQTCDRTKVFHIDFQLLKMRFLATFFWPALLSTLVPNENESEAVDTADETADEKGSPVRLKKSFHRRRKRKQKKPWVTELLKRRHVELQHTLREKPVKPPVERRRKYNKASKNQPPTRRSTRCATKAVTNV